MTKDQIQELKLSHPEGYEKVVEGMYEWQTYFLIQNLIHWIPRSEFLKLIHQAEKNNETG